VYGGIRHQCQEHSILLFLISREFSPNFPLSAVEPSGSTSLRVRLLQRCYLPLIQETGTKESKHILLYPLVKRESERQF
jgi:hypothetical protein